MPARWPRRWLRSPALPSPTKAICWNCLWPQYALAPPGTYTIQLTVAGKAFTERAVVTNDPRSPAKPAEVAAQAVLLSNVQRGIKAAWEGSQQVAAMRRALATSMSSDTASDDARANRAFRAKIDSVGIGSAAAPVAFQQIHARLISQLVTQENGDHAPTAAMLEAYASACRNLTKAATAWQTINTTDLPALNARGMKNVPVARGVMAPKC